MKRKNAIIEKYAAGGWCITLPDGSQFEADTAGEAINFAYGEGATRVYSKGFYDKYILIGKEDSKEK